MTNNELKDNNNSKYKTMTVKMYMCVCARAHVLLDMELKVDD